MTIAINKTIATLPHLSTFLAENSDAVVGWGRKASGRRAQWLARLLRRNFVLLEDGFIRSVARQDPPLSLIVDDVGVYYDAFGSSRMEQAISRGADAAQAEHARRLAHLWREHRVSKYNHSPEFAGTLPLPYVLVVDQTFGDLSIDRGLAATSSFNDMLAAALNEHPDATIIVKVHPDVITKGRRGHFSSEMLQHERVMTMGGAYHSPSLIEHAAAVYTVTSLMGFEALLWNRPVRCFGMPFYAGWGLTEDMLVAPSRRHRARLEDIVHAALVEAARYADPVNGEAWDAERAILHVGRERERLLAAGTLHS